MYIKVSPFRRSPPEVFFKEYPSRHEINPQQNTNTEVRSQQSRFATLLKSHPCTYTLPEIPSTSAEHPAYRENTSGGLILHVKRILKVLYYENFLFTIVKRSSLAVKMDNNNTTTNNNNKSNKCQVIVSRNPRNAPRFFHWALLLWH